MKDWRIWIQSRTRACCCSWHSNLGAQNYPSQHALPRHISHVHAKVHIQLVDQSWVSTIGCVQTMKFYKKDGTFFHFVFCWRLKKNWFHFIGLRRYVTSLHALSQSIVKIGGGRNETLVSQTAPLPNFPFRVVVYKHMMNRTSLDKIRLTIREQVNTNITDCNHYLFILLVLHLRLMSSIMERLH